uniref:Tesmin/TSO1-like CXC domain-containing protein n=3 Tax=Lygus hesperus TaxID=30085 RepID=A0A0K8SZB8_LYGHE
MSGCDTTSAFFRQGKMKFVSALEKSPNLRDAAKFFKTHNSTHEEVAAAGEQFLAAVYSPKDEGRTLDELRFSIFTKTLTKTAFDLTALPPTSTAAKQHFFRVYHQVQAWYGSELDPITWGWRRSAQGLLPVTTTKDPAPSEVLRAIACKCVQGCRGKCSCRKAGLKCSTICLNCRGQACSNAPTEEEEVGISGPINVDDEVEAMEGEKQIEEAEDGSADEHQEAWGPASEDPEAGPSSKCT